uniref:Zinc finger FYVE domain-containing protein n=1 Tax=Xenopus laevis TaxID=8355 RepID=B7ZSC0_XENLA|nr:Smad anchor for receptor activation [Xenopus laevis]AAI70474.1 Smad anchor for receptor activation [Xenopus laevis]
MPKMVIGDTIMAEDSLFNNTGPSEIVCNPSTVESQSLQALDDQSVNIHNEKSVLLADGFSPCSSPKSIINFDCLTMDNEMPLHSQMSVDDNDKETVTISVLPTIIQDTSNVSTDPAINKPGTKEPHRALKETTSVILPEIKPYSTCAALSFENNNKVPSYQLNNTDLLSVSPVVEACSEQQQKHTSSLHEEKLFEGVSATESFAATAAETVLDNEALRSAEFFDIVVKNFSDSCVIDGDLTKSCGLSQESNEKFCASKEFEGGVDANVLLENACVAYKEAIDLPEENGTNAPMSLYNGCDSYGMKNPAVAQNPKNLPSKEDSVTEEKEIEESKSEYYTGVYEQQREDDVTERGGLLLNAKADQMKNNLHSLCNQVPSMHGQTSPKKGKIVQSLSVPYGGARPKQPTHLKLHIPKPLSEMLQSDLIPPNAGCSSKYKNDMLNKSNQGDNLISESLREDSAVRSPVTDANGEFPGEYRGPGSLCLAVSPDSPDNDLLAGQFGVPISKPFTTLGEVAPVWVPDSQAPNCMKCEARFTFTKRRHHCRACGKVFCAACCSLKCKLQYMDKKEARVCVICHSVLMNAQAWENMLSASVQSPNPNNPAEYCSTIPPMQQAQASGALSSPPPTVMVPVGVLKHPGTEGSQSKEQRRVWFADGILPNGETADSDNANGTTVAGTLTVSHTNNSTSSESENTSGFCGSITQVGSAMNLIPEDGLPPILISTGVKGDYAVEERPSQMSVMQQLEEGGPDPLVFVLNANLLAMVKIVNYVNRKCWCFTTKGMHAVGQAEIVILLQCLPDEKCLPRDLFSHFVELYQEAIAGNVVGNLGHSFLSQSFLGSKDHGGFLYVAPTYQSLQDLVLPAEPYLFGILIQKWETPWAKVFPIRLMLRLGAEYRLYPCPLFSVRYRKPLFGETGHTIINVLADFRNYQYTLPVVQGLVVDMEVRKTSIKIPSNRYNEMMKAMNKSNEHVLAIGACFNQMADSHLVCVQNDDGNYQTQAISIHKQPRKVTGASFFVFSGALKSSSGYLAKSSIVEDGVMVQITAESMDALRQSLREMKDFTITCGKADAEESQEHVYVQWVEDDKNFNKGVFSPIDGKSMESVTSVKIFHGSEYKASGKIIRWIEVFFLDNEEQQSGLSDPADHSRLTENVAKAFCLALCPHLKLLKEDGMTRLGLRVSLDSDQVGYQAGSNGQLLHARYTNDLDGALVPVIHGGTCQLSEGPVSMELIFYILENIS